MRRKCGSDVLPVRNKRKACKEFVGCMSAVVENYLIADTNNSLSPSLLLDDCTEI